jgi:hypothetical protein
VLYCLAVCRNCVFDQAHLDSPKSRCKSGIGFATTRRVVLFMRIQLSLSLARGLQSIVKALEGGDGSGPPISFPVRPTTIGPRYRSMPSSDGTPAAL